MNYLYKNGYEGYGNTRSVSVYGNTPRVLVHQCSNGYAKIQLVC